MADTTPRKCASVISLYKQTELDQKRLQNLLGLVEQLFAGLSTELDSAVSSF